MNPKIRIEEKTVSIDRIEPNPWNPNEMSEMEHNSLVTSMRRYGQVIPINVRRMPGDRYQIIDGENRWKVAKELGMEEILINDLGDVPESEARLQTVFENELRGDPDEALLASLIRKQQEGDDWDEVRQLFPMTDTKLEELLSIGTEVDEPDNSTDITFSGGDGGQGGTSGTQWVDLKFYIPVEEFIDITEMTETAREAKGIQKQADPALTYGQVLKQIVMEEMNG